MHIQCVYRWIYTHTRDFLYTPIVWVLKVTIANAHICNTRKKYSNKCTRQLFVRSKCGALCMPCHVYVCTWQSWVQDTHTSLISTSDGCLVTWRTANMAHRLYLFVYATCIHARSIPGSEVVEQTRDRDHGSVGGSSFRRGRVFHQSWDSIAICVCVCIYLRMCVYICVCMYILM